MTTTHGNIYTTHTHYHQETNPYWFADHEPGLWRAVITQALMDAASQSRKSEAKRSRSAAMDWLLSNDSDFEYVCDNAGLDPDYVRTRARRALEQGFNWRLPNGEGWRTKAKLAALQALEEASQHTVN